MSSSGSSPVAAAAWLISARRLPATARRVEGRRRGLSDLPGRVVRRVDQAVFLGVLVQAAQRGDEMLGGAAPAAGVPPRYHVGPHVLDELPDLRRRRLVDTAITPLLDYPVPVRAVCPSAAVADQG